MESDKALLMLLYFVSQKGNKPTLYDDPWYNHIVDFVELAKSIVNMKKSLMIKPTRKWVYTSDEEANDYDIKDKRLKTDNDLNTKGTAIDDQNPISTSEEINYVQATSATSTRMIED